MGWQLEVLVSFFVGFYKEDGAYEDRLPVIALRNLASPFRFWSRVHVSRHILLVDLAVFLLLLLLL